MRQLRLSLNSWQEKTPVEPRRPEIGALVPATADIQIDSPLQGNAHALFVPGGDRSQEVLQEPWLIDLQQNHRLQPTQPGHHIGADTPPAGQEHLVMVLERFGAPHFCLEGPDLILGGGYQHGAQYLQVSGSAHQRLDRAGNLIVIDKGDEIPMRPVRCL